ncbi:MAG: DNA primase [Ruminiclostridium sp.]
MPLPDGFLDELKLNNDIVSVMSSYVNLKRAGRDYVCSCPFHSEKTPSCHVYTENQSFYCFGCGAGGDVINFIRRIESLDYIESVRFLAQRAGMNMPEDASDKTAMQRTRMLEMNREAARFFRDQLISPQGEEGWRYLIDRGLTPNTIKRYGLGYAVDDWHTLRLFMKSKGYTDFELADAALIARNNNNFYDKFRHRVMFPIIDRRGNIIGFGGRTLEKDAPAKYLNSDETLVFKKRSNIFSLNFAKNTKEKYFILCEGYMDVIALNQAGFTNAVATLGTAITPEQARLMKQYCDEVVISYDSDEAGQKATMKAINLLSEAGISTRVLQMDGAKDPDEYIKKYGAEAFRLLIEKSGSAISFELEKAKRGLNLDTAEGRSAYLKKAVTLLADIDSKLDRMVYISDVAKQCELSVQNVELAVEDQLRRKGYRAREQENKMLLNSLSAHDKINPDADKYPTEEKAERGIIAYLFHSPDKLKKILAQITAEDFPTAFNRKLFETLKNRIENNISTDISSIGGEFSAEEVGRIMSIVKEADILPYTNERLNDYISVLVNFRETKHRKDASEMTAAELLEYMEQLKNRKK